MQLSPFILLGGTFESWDLYSIFIDFFYSSTLPRKPVQCRLISSLSLLYLSLRQPSPSSPFSPLQPPPVCAYRIFALNQKPKQQRNSRKRRRQQKTKMEVQWNCAEQNNRHFRTLLRLKRFVKDDNRSWSGPMQSSVRLWWSCYDPIMILWWFKTIVEH